MFNILFCHVEHTILIIFADNVRRKTGFIIEEHGKSKFQKMSIDAGSYSV